MGFDLSDAENESKHKWLAKMKKSDPRHARLFCNRCVKYLGAAGVCNCE